MHRRDIMHRDIKPENILITEQCQVKICDFGCAKKIHQNEGLNRSLVVSAPYRAPEVVLLGKYGTAADV